MTAAWVIDEITKKCQTFYEYHLRTCVEAFKFAQFGVLKRIISGLDVGWKTKGYDFKPALQVTD